MVDTGSRGPLAQSKNIVFGNEKWSTALQNLPVSQCTKNEVLKATNNRIVRFINFLISFDVNVNCALSRGLGQLSLLRNEIIIISPLRLLLPARRDNISLFSREKIIQKAVMTQVMVINCSISCNDQMFSIGLLARDSQKLIRYQAQASISSGAL